MQEFDWKERIDFAAILDSRAWSIQSGCSLQSLYKYYHFADKSVLSGFLSRPTLKFATKSELNDPFDLSRRWEKFGSAAIIDFVKSYVVGRFESEIDDKNALVRRMAADPRFKNSGISIAGLRKIISSAPARAYIAEYKTAFYMGLPAQLEEAFAAFAPELDAQIAGAFESMGLLSLTEDPLNRAMWGLYASSGQGFALEFDAQHPFFLSQKKDGSSFHKLMKVLYTDERWDDFWQNPLSLFAVKNSEFSFEREWRLLMGIERCEVISLPTGNLYLVPMPSTLLKSVIFGHRASRADCDAVYGELSRQYPSLKAFRAYPNPETGAFELRSFM
jgi:hypothetical protein